MNVNEDRTDKSGETFCTYKGRNHKVVGFGERSDENMKEFLCLNKFYVETVDPYGRFTRVDLVSCSDFRQL